MSSTIFDKGSYWLGSVASVVNGRKIGYSQIKDVAMPFHISSKLLKYFKGFYSSPEIIMLFVYMKCRFSLSYQDLEEMAIIRGAKIDHAPLAFICLTILRFINLKYILALPLLLNGLLLMPLYCFNKKSNSGKSVASKIILSILLKYPHLSSICVTCQDKLPKLS